jgi:hypothetical protein
VEQGLSALVSGNAMENVMVAACDLRPLLSDLDTFATVSQVAIEGPVVALGDIVFRIGSHSIVSGGGGSKLNAVSIEITLISAPPSVVLPTFATGQPSSSSASSSSAAAASSSSSAASVPPIIANALALALGSKWKSQCNMDSGPSGAQCCNWHFCSTCDAFCSSGASAALDNPGRLAVLYVRDDDDDEAAAAACCCCCCCL